MPAYHRCWLLLVLSPRRTCSALDIAMMLKTSFPGRCFIYWTFLYPTMDQYILVYLISICRVLGQLCFGQSVCSTCSYNTFITVDIYLDTLVQDKKYKYMEQLYKEERYRVHEKEDRKGVVIINQYKKKSTTTKQCSSASSKIHPRLLFYHRVIPVCIRSESRWGWRKRVFKTRGWM